MIEAGFLIFNRLFELAAALLYTVCLARSCRNKAVVEKRCSFFRPAWPLTWSAASPIFHRGHPVWSGQYCWP